MKTTKGMLVIVGGLALAGFVTIATLHLQQLQARVIALEKARSLQDARARVIVRALEQSPRLDLDASGVTEMTKLLATAIQQ